ncbi:MAG: thiamine-phosphate kinase [Desulfococcaceae bacterium]
MKLQDIGEFGFIDRIGEGCLVRRRDVVQAIGDDAAAFRTPDGEVTLLTADMLVERVHFLRNKTTGFDLGYKSLAVNLSDIAAMGGTAREAFVSIAVPEDCPLEFLDDLYKGMRALAEKYDVNILGGDTTGSPADLVINISVTGSIPEDEILLRSGAQPGDSIFVTGCLGDSKAGLHLILNDIEADSPELQALITAHDLPEPHLREGRFLSRADGVHAAIDVSDGLSSDLGHILKRSGVGARIYEERLPITDPLTHFCKRFDFTPAELAVSGGEDYVLLGTVSSGRSKETARQFLNRFKRPLFLIGEITESEGMVMARLNGQEETIRPSSWEHFKAK